MSDSSASEKHDLTRHPQAISNAYMFGCMHWQWKHLTLLIEQQQELSERLLNHVERYENLIQGGFLGPSCHDFSDKGKYSSTTLNTIDYNDQHDKGFQLNRERAPFCYNEDRKFYDDKIRAKEEKNEDRHRLIGKAYNFVVDNDSMRYSQRQNLSDDASLEDIRNIAVSFMLHSVDPSKSLSSRVLPHDSLKSKLQHNKKKRHSIDDVMNIWEQASVLSFVQDYIETECLNEYLRKQGYDFAAIERQEKTVAANKPDSKRKQKSLKKSSTNYDNIMFSPGVYPPLLCQLPPAHQSDLFAQVSFPPIVVVSPTTGDIIETATLQQTAPAVLTTTLPSSPSDVPSISYPPRSTGNPRRMFPNPVVLSVPGEIPISENRFDQVPVGAYARFFIALFLLDAPVEITMLCFILASLHLLGAFDPLVYQIDSLFIRLGFDRTRPLAEILRELRARRNFQVQEAQAARAATQVLRDLERTTEQLASTTTPLEVPLQQEEAAVLSSTRERYPSEGSSSAVLIPPQGDGSTPPSATSTSSLSPVTTSERRQAQQSAVVQHLVYLIRFVYQLFIAFICSLNPHWEPLYGLILPDGAGHQNQNSAQNDNSSSSSSITTPINASYPNSTNDVELPATAERTATAITRAVPDSNPKHTISNLATIMDESLVNDKKELLNDYHHHRQLHEDSQTTNSDSIKVFEDNNFQAPTTMQQKLIEDSRILESYNIHETPIPLSAVSNNQNSLTSMYIQKDEKDIQNPLQMNNDDVDISLMSSAVPLNDFPDHAIFARFNKKPSSVSICSESSSSSSLSA